MNKILALFGCCIVVLASGGCGSKNCHPRVGNQVRQKDSNNVWDGESQTQDPMPDFFVDKARTGAIPEFIAGVVWETALPPAVEWRIKVEPDGSIKRIVHAFAGQVKIEDNMITGEGPDKSLYAILMGPCEARYVPEERMLQVKIVVDYFLMKMPSGEIEGRMEDYFEGPVSEDGRTWTTEWLSFKWIRGSTLPDVNAIKANPELLVFMKHDFTQGEQ